MGGDALSYPPHGWALGEIGQQIDLFLGDRGPFLLWRETSWATTP